MTREKQEEIIKKLKDVLEELSHEYWMDNNKDYKYKKDEWEEILKGNDYY